MPDSQPYHLGQIVRLKSQPDKIGAVVEVKETDPEYQYTVLIDGKASSYFTSQLIADDEPSQIKQVLSATECQALLTARLINHPSTSTLYSLNAARIDFVPYQYRPVLRFLRADRPRLLIADGVGVGKTIEAGLILRELQARQEINSVLIICPRPLLSEKKWQTEMKRFDQNFEHFDGKMLRHCISECDLDGEWPERHQFGIIPYSILNEEIITGTKTGKNSKKPCLLDLDPAPHFDLVIVDEAHRISNPTTYGHEAVKYFCDNAEAVIFLTATPLQLGNCDLFSLLKLLRPDVVIDRDSFDHMSEPNPMINEAVRHARSASVEWQSKALESLKKAQSTSWGASMLTNNPEVDEITDKLSSPDASEQERIIIIDQLENLHTFSGIINRTRRRDIGEFTIRQSHTVEVPFTDSQNTLHDALLKVQSDILADLHGSRSVNFMMSTIRRQAASCLYGLAPYIKDILSRHICEEELSEVDIEDFGIESGDLNSIAERIQSVIAMANNLDKKDPKLEKVIQLVNQKQEAQIYPNHRIMIFSSFRHTLHYLKEGLLSAGIRVGLVHGNVPDEERTTVRHRFERPKDDPEALDVVLFSEVGCEGLDYQFCDCIINYDLPWNPMRIEQRIGRIDRNGQKSQFVSVYNMITPGTVDADIYERCLMRIGIFEQAVGASEDILGKITKELNEIAVKSELTPAERQVRLRQLEDNEIRQLLEEEKLEEKQHEFFGISLPLKDRFKVDVDNATSYWLEPEAIQNMLSTYLETINESAAILGKTEIKSLRINEEARKKMLQDARVFSSNNDIQQRNWEKWLKGNEPHLPITFDGETANEDRSVQLLSPVHPLTRQAAFSFDTHTDPEIHLSVTDNRFTEGVYPFAIYQWDFIGLRHDLELIVISDNESISSHFFELMQVATDSDSVISEMDLTTLESLHYNCWKVALDFHRRKVIKLAEFKRQSLKASYEGRIAMLNDRLRSATEKKIQRMREAEINRANREYEERSAELSSSVENHDIRYEQVLVGTIRIS
ncbi:DEAD/DEAH box helicase [Gimesia chilikensis]|uniref:RNA polymerase-associated protein RapA n=1 Tax=Gimesia chilikensis TaxID=2605989 RepID=A0A517PYE7_9PLAN|nr:helicase-related protein [Gimesia chilikensis]QDT24352.1 RNA polymerase-associated protein RapA [Gimesia chilikensis]